ncbi:helix-turn-helix domain-containing protein [Avibacterium paragallinarum]|nr:helix-turn-helix transcriptional regulator [Avibacterium paragallinarum]QIR12803.1 helix-turn-helix transcriptional regulator [Avibacterium paragallinarum]QJE10759.1 helix-turn-helix transcriptional regulator [Avibacterium paragallinarum]QJE12952.1 helix-turn-helix transcriptional regulator [Avibacterium paragallinarum]QJE17355.1 helix-turn-helix transcriptional regulator [Avibacterium paragallinarum]QJE19547.1 helix-turn-helix transcriptional regulator [Avibacterium paragallinarum]
MKKKGFPPKPSELEIIFNLNYYGQHITPQTASQWLNGKMIPRLDKLRVLSTILNVNLSYLVPPDTLQKLQEGELRRMGKPKAYHWEKLAEEQDKALFHQFLTLPEMQKNVVREVIVALAERYNKKQK